MMLYEELLGGIVHSINNTFTVIDVSLELASPTDAARELATVRREMTKLESHVALITLLSNRSAPAEALEIRSVMDLALSIAAFHTTTRMVALTLRITGEVPPVRAPRTDLMRVLLMLIDGAKRAAMASGGAAQIEIDGDAERVVIRAPKPPVAAVDAEQCAVACGGTFVIRDDAQVLELPSLQWTRRTGSATPA